MKTDDPISSDEEKKYIQKALKAGIQSTEILNVLVISRSVYYVLDNLVSAMENKDHIVYSLRPNDIQAIYTIMKNNIQLERLRTYKPNTK